MNVTYSIYERVSGEAGKPFMCHVFSGGQSRLVFSGATAAEAEAEARYWMDRNYDTPERRARITEAARKRAEKKRLKKEDGSVA